MRRDLTMDTTVAARPGLSQYSADSPETRITTTPGSSLPLGNQASVKVFHSSAFLLGSSTTEAVPAIESQELLPE